MEEEEEEENDNMLKFLMSRPENFADQLRCFVYYKTISGQIVNYNCVRL